MKPVMSLIPSYLFIKKYKNLSFVHRTRKTGDIIFAFVAMPQQAEQKAAPSGFGFFLRIRLLAFLWNSVPFHSL